MNVQRGVKIIGGLLNRNSPTILTGGAVMGLVGTVILAVGATPKAVQLIETEQYETRELLTVPGIIQVGWRCYVPAVVMGLLTIGCIIGSNKINMRRNAALAAVYSLSEAALKEYQKKVVETIGENREKGIKDSIHKDTLLSNPIRDNEVIITGKGETLCYEVLSGRYFKSDIEHIRQALNKINTQMLYDTSVTLNELYSSLDLRSTKMGDLIGWTIEIKPDFSSQLTDTGIPCLVLDYMSEPTYIYRD